MSYALRPEDLQVVSFETAPELEPEEARFARATPFTLMGDTCPAAICIARTVAGQCL